MGSQLLRPLSIGEILDGGFTVYRRHFAVFVGVSLTFLLPALVLALLVPLLGTFANGILNLAAVGGCVWMASEVILGNAPAFQEAIGVGLRKMLPLFGWGILYGLGIVVGLVLLIVPGIVLWIIWFAFWPVVVLERVPPFGRSQRLAKGSWQKIFVVGVVGMIIVALPQFVLYFGATLVMGYDATVAANQPTPPLLQFAAILLTALTVPFTTSLQTLLYYDQRVRKEGFDVQHTAATLGATAGR